MFESTWGSSFSPWNKCCYKNIQWCWQVADPWAGSHMMECLTNDMYDAALSLINEASYPFHNCLSVLV